MRLIKLCFFALLAAVAGSLLAYSIKESMSKEAIEKRLEPIGEVKVIGDENAAPLAAVAKPNGQTIFETYCVACHGQGIAGAPKFGDKAAWAPRMKQGRDTLVNAAIHGIRAMPPKGTCVTCSEKDIGDVVDYMLAKVK